MMIINGRMGLSRRSDDKICIEVEDEASGVKFLVAEIEPYDFAQLITGLHGVKAQCHVKGLDFVGRKKVREARSVICGIDSYNNDKLREWLLENCQEEGWIIDSYLGSQNSISRCHEGTRLNYSVYRYQDFEK
jgi:hypothetical protein